MSLEHYSQTVLGLLQQICVDEAQGMRQAAAWVAESIAADGLVYTFGTGHSQLLACEGFFRAGGLAPVSLMLESPLGFEGGAIASSFFERASGYAALIVERYPLGPGDVLLLFSNSAANAVPLEVAQAARAKGTRVVAIISRQYAQMKGSKIPDVADLVLDNHGPPGDATVAVGEEVVGPVSTVLGAFILNAVLSEASALLVQGGLAVPAYRSSNMPGAPEHNAHLIKRYRSRIRHL